MPSSVPFTSLKLNGCISTSPEVDWNDLDDDGHRGSVRKGLNKSTKPRP